MAMNAYGNAFNTYKNNSVNFASKDQLLLMLVDGAAKFSKMGRQAILDKDIKKAHDNIVKTQNIYWASNEIYLLPPISLYNRICPAALLGNSYY